jgi:putative ABC transport system permease protein
MKLFSEARPILSALRGQRAAATLLMLEIALTLAVLCNLVFIVAGTLQRAGTPSGAMETDIALIQSIGVIGSDNPSSTSHSLSLLQAVPGMEAVAFGGAPFWNVDRTPLFSTPDAQQPLAQAYQFVGSQGLNRTLGVQVLQGQDIIDAEIPRAIDLVESAQAGRTPPQMPALLTRTLANRLFPDGSAVGRTLHTSVWGLPATLRVVGVMAPLRGEITGRPDDEDAILAEFKVTNEGLGGGYIIRSKPGQLQQVLPLAAEVMQQANPGHVQQQVKAMTELRTNYFRHDRAVARMLIAIMAILLIITGLGVGGLASFWVQQRTKQIGIRRALGATRYDILRYFQLENFLIVSGGVVLGTTLAFGVNQWLMHHFEIGRLSNATVVIGMAVVWALGQLAVLGPALRAAAVPPVIATRSA